MQPRWFDPQDNDDGYNYPAGVDHEEWRRKHPKAPLVTKKLERNDRTVRKIVSRQSTGNAFILSDETPDRYSDIILTSGWILENFRRNPIALFSHAGSFPIGQWRNVRVSDGALRGTLELAPAGTSDRIDELRKLVDAGILRAVSVGFSPLASEPRKDVEFGTLYTRQELMEVSLVSVPANPSALVVAKELSISRDTQDLVFGDHSVERSERDDERPHRLPALLAGPMDAASDKAWNAWADAKIRKAIRKHLQEYTDDILIKKINGEIEVSNHNIEFISTMFRVLRAEWCRDIREELLRFLEMEKPETLTNQLKIEIAGLEGRLDEMNRNLDELHQKGKELKQNVEEENGQ